MAIMEGRSDLGVFRSIASAPSDEDVSGAASFWSDWRGVLEHQGPSRMNPLLSDPACFNDFVLALGIARSFRAGRREDFRAFVASPGFPLEELLADESGAKVDSQDALLRSRFGAFGQGSSLRAVLAKLVAMLRPQAFPEYDGRIRTGMEILSGTGSRELERYSDFLCVFNSLLQRFHNELDQLCKLSNLDASQYSSGFRRKVLVHVLGRIGTHHRMRKR